MDNKIFKGAKVNMRQVFSSIALVGLMFSNVAASNLEVQVLKEQKEEMLNEQFIKGQILQVKVVGIGENTVKSLKANLDFINKLEKDPTFRNCIVLKGGIERIEALKLGAKKLYQEGKVEKSDYANYIQTLNAKKEKLTNKISNQCKKD